MYIDGELKLGYNKSTLHFHAIFTHTYSSFARPKSKCVPIILKCLRTARTPQLTCNDSKLHCSPSVDNNNEKLDLGMKAITEIAHKCKNIR